MVMAGGFSATLGDDGQRTADTADASVVVTDRVRPVGSGNRRLQAAGESRDGG
jgi:hypothetical protein